jgi:hypothetical protein
MLHQRIERSKSCKKVIEHLHICPRRTRIRSRRPWFSVAAQTFQCQTQPSALETYVQSNPLWFQTQRHPPLLPISDLAVGETISDGKRKSELRELILTYVLEIPINLTLRRAK